MLYYKKKKSTFLSQNVTDTPEACQAAKIIQTKWQQIATWHMADEPSDSK